MKRVNGLIKMLLVMVFISGITLNAIDQANHVSHGKNRRIELLSNHEVLEIVVDHLDIHLETLSDVDIKLVDEHYELSFDVNSVTYNFKVHSITVEILELNN